MSVALFQGANGGFKSSANAAMRGRGGGSRYRGPPRGKGKSAGGTNYNNSRSDARGNNNNGGSRPSSNNNRGHRNNSTKRPDTIRC